MKKINIVVFASALIAGLLSLSPLAEAAGLKLASLAGNWGGEGGATFGVCFNTGFLAVEDCGTAPNVAFFNSSDVTQSTVDKNGNSCTTQTEAEGPEFPAAPATPATTLNQILVGTITSYNPATESGLESFTVYNAGSGTSCNGSVLVNTANAAPTGTVMGSFVITQKGTRNDFVVLTLENTPISDAEDVVAHAVSFKQ